MKKQISENEIYALYRKHFNGNWHDFEDAYVGQYRSDIEFAQEMAEQCGMIQRNVSWPYTCIDWEFAARELMYDYISEDGHYFRYC